MSKTRRHRRLHQRQLHEQISLPARYRVTLALFALGLLVLAWRAVDLQVLESAALQARPQASSMVREHTLLAMRGRILDRHGMSLAISVPVVDVVLDPLKFVRQPLAQQQRLAKVVDRPWSEIQRGLIGKHRNSHYWKLRGQVAPELGQRVRELALHGVAIKRGMKRFYPAADRMAPMIGFTNAKGVGAEGLERTYERVLRGTNGNSQTIKTARIKGFQTDVAFRRYVPPDDGRDLRLTLDQSMQDVAYEALREAVQYHQAKSASMVVLDSRTGALRVAATYPSFNPNSRHKKLVPNRPVVDLFEPGSSVKPFTVAAALQTDVADWDTILDTGRGVLRVGRYRIRDAHRLGKINLRVLLQKSSNIGAAKLALRMEASVLPTLLQKAGFGWSTGLGVPLEPVGGVNIPDRWHASEQAALAYGYGMNTSLLQLARAWLVFANDGIWLPVHLFEPARPGKPTRVMSAAVAQQIRQVLEGVVSKHGTAVRAKIAHVRVAGKTGTIKKAMNGRYGKAYRAVFVGVVPASAPRFVAAVMVDDPKQHGFYGGQAAAPVFAKVMQACLHMENIPQDGLDLHRVALPQAKVVL